MLGAKDSGSDNWGDTSQSNNLLLLMEGFQSFLNVSMHRHISAFKGKVREVLSRAETTR